MQEDNLNKLKSQSANYRGGNSKLRNVQFIFYDLTQPKALARDRTDFRKLVTESLTAVGSYPE